MNPYTGDLVKMKYGEELRAQFERVPKALLAEAERELAGRSETRVDLRKSGPLQAWAKKKRQAKIAAKSRRINRGR